MSPSIPYSTVCVSVREDPHERGDDTQCQARTLVYRLTTPVLPLSCRPALVSQSVIQSLSQSAEPWH